MSCHDAPPTLSCPSFTDCPGRCALPEGGREDGQRLCCCCCCCWVSWPRPHTAPSCSCSTTRIQWVEAVRLSRHRLNPLKASYITSMLEGPRSQFTIPLLQIHLSNASPYYYYDYLFHFPMHHGKSDKMAVSPDKVMTYTFRVQILHQMFSFT